jgi:hypothetical protein
MIVHFLKGQEELNFSKIGQKEWFVLFIIFSFLKGRVIIIL